MRLQNYAKGLRLSWERIEVRLPLRGSGKPSWLSPVKFIVPFALWIFLFRDFFLKNALIDGDTFNIFGIARFFVQHMIQGVFPSWDPLVLWGKGIIRQIGEFNPIWFLIVIMETLGFQTYHAFLVTVIAYFFLSAIGFYMLAKVLTHDAQAAYVAFLIFLFSSVGITMFVQLTFLMIFAPVIWFFYFLINFFQTGKKYSFLLMTYSLVQILTTYIPFYFLTLFLTFLITFCLVYFRKIKSLAKEYFHFFTKNKGIVALCCLAVALAIFSQIMTWLSLQGELRPLARPAQLTYKVVRNGGLPVNEILRDFSLFSFLFHAAQLDVLTSSRELFHLKNFTFDNQRILYIPIMAHVILLGSLWTKMSRKLLVSILVCFFMFWLVILDMTPLYEVLFKNVFYFSMFRNVFFLLPLFLASYILVTVQQWNKLRTELEASKNRIIKIGGGLIIHGLLLAFLKTQPNVCTSTYVTIGASAIVWVCMVLKIGNAKRGLWTLVIALLILLQPVEVLSGYVLAATRNRSSTMFRYLSDIQTQLKFSYTRPGLNRGQHEHQKAIEIYRNYNLHYLNFKDSPGFTSFRYGYPTKWSYLLAKNVNYEKLRAYVTHKFVVYDNFKFVTSSEMSMQAIANELQKLSNTAYVNVEEKSVEQKHAEQPQQLKAILPTQRARLIRAESTDFQVTSFTPNEISFKTNFNTDKFLVYNDSFHTRWRAWINDQRVPLYRANSAFKGISLPGGPNRVVMRYEPLGGGNRTYLGILIFYNLFFLAGITMCCKESKEAQTAQ